MTQRILLAGIFILFAFHSRAETGSRSIEPYHARPYSVQFIDEMSAHHEGGVEMAEMAISKAYHSKLKEMAKMMKQAQQEELAKMADWRVRWYSSSPSYTYMGAEMDMSKLEKLSGPEFDIAFLDTMIMHHPGAIFLGREAAGRSEKSEIRAFGKKISNAQQKELNEMRKMRDNWTKQ
ncbi:DUF305 domain-containing protein [Bdellovibrio sp. SKB1291214]|uniref:DUF305 domain-containing protein n=1 Tax=unclassified Bdellovibrio TaxID=2633795 RepID=UPI00143D31D9|nr:MULTISPECIES: DUF305 domain-containing protein [unclassified Bdellovibrio]UYL07435.1 DUF305 domain-containing protein [Bdellovibrio sp. SKB1291214]